MAACPAAKTLMPTAVCLYTSSTERESISFSFGGKAAVAAV